MTEPKFTKGPWRIAGKGTIRTDDAWVASINWRNRDANARLIAAAPQLYEALKEARGWVVLAEDLCRDNSKALALIDAALFSATGEA